MEPAPSVGQADTLTVTSATTNRLSGRMGPLQLAFTVLAYNAPAVVFLGFIPVSILVGNGIGTPFAYLVCGGIVTLLAIGLLTMARHLDNPGGFYGFITAGLGKVVGLGSGFAAMSCYFVACLGGYALGGMALRALSTELLGGPELQWWIGAILMFLVAAVLGYFRIELSAKVLTIFLACELALMVFYDLAVIAKLGFGAFVPAPFELSNILSGSVGVAVMFGVGVFGGFEATIIFRDEVRNPARTIARATYLVIALMAGLYALTAWIFINSYGINAVVAAVEADPTGAATASVREYAGSLAADTGAVLLLTSSFALILAGHNIVSRYVFNLSADGILPRSLSEVHRQHASPHRASIATSLATLLGLILLALAQLDPNMLYAKLAGAYAYTALILFVIVAGAIATYLIRNRSSMTGRAVLPATGTIIAGIAMVFALYTATVHFDLVTGATGVTAITLLGLIYGVVLVGMVTAAVYRKTRPDVYARIGRQDT